MKRGGIEEVLDLLGENVKEETNTGQVHWGGLRGGEGLVWVFPVGLIALLACASSRQYVQTIWQQEPHCSQWAPGRNTITSACPVVPLILLLHLSFQFLSNELPEHYALGISSEPSVFTFLMAEALRPWEAEQSPGHSLGYCECLMVKIKVHCALFFPPDLINTESNALCSMAKKSTMWSLICQSVFMGTIWHHVSKRVLLGGGNVVILHNGCELGGVMSVLSGGRTTQ